MKRLLLAILLTFSLVGCATVAPNQTGNQGSDVIDNIHHYGVIGTDGIGANFKGFIIIPAGVTYYNSLIARYGGTPQDTMGSGLLIGFTPALITNYGLTPRPDGNFDMTEEAHIKYKTMIGWDTASVKSQKP
jgi:hypothetical protein